MNEARTTGAQDSNSRGHEQSDANIRALTIFGLGLMVLTGVTLLLMVWLQDYLQARKAGSEPPPSPLAPERTLPPEPRLQVIPEKDLEQLHAMEDSLLNHYGWIVREANLVRIPIDSAIALIARRGLPARAESEERKARGEERSATGEKGKSQP